MATSRAPREPSATFGIVGAGPLTVKGDGATVSITAPHSLALALTVAEARVLAHRLLEECERG